MYNGQPITKMACGAEFSMLMDCKGNLYSFGCPEYGQLGMGLFLKSSDLTVSVELEGSWGCAHTSVIDPDSSISGSAACG